MIVPVHVVKIMSQFCAQAVRKTHHAQAHAILAKCDDRPQAISQYEMEKICPGEQDAKR